MATKGPHFPNSLLFLLLNYYWFLSNLLRGSGELKVSKFQKQIFLFSFEPKTRTKLFFDFYPKAKGLKGVK